MMMLHHLLWFNVLIFKLVSPTDRLMELFFLFFLSNMLIFFLNR